MPPMSTISAPCSTTSATRSKALSSDPGGALVVEGVRGPVDDRHHQSPVVGERVPAETERHARDPASPSGASGRPLSRRPAGARGSRISRRSVSDPVPGLAVLVEGDVVGGRAGGAPAGGGEDLRRHRAEVAQGLRPVGPATEVDLGDRVGTEQPDGCRSARPARRRTRSGTESRSNRSRRTAHSPASGCTSQLSSGHSSAISGRATSSVTRPPSQARSPAAVVAGAAVRRSPLTRATPSSASSGPSRPRHEVGVPVDEVGVHEHDQVAAGHEQGLPHRLALAGVGAEVGADLARAVHDGTRGRGDRVGRRRSSRSRSPRSRRAAAAVSISASRTRPTTSPTVAASLRAGTTRLVVSPVVLLRSSSVVEVPVVPVVRALVGVTPPT